VCVSIRVRREDSVLCSGVVCVREYWNSTVDLFFFVWFFVWFDVTRFVVVVVVVVAAAVGFLVF